MAARVLGRSSTSFPISVRSRSHASASTSLGKSAASGSVSCPRRWRRMRRRPRSAARSACRRTEASRLAPFVTRSTTSASSGCASSRLGPTVPDVPASESTWQPPQFVVKMTLPATGSPSTAGVVSVVVVSVVSVSVVSVSVVSVSVVSVVSVGVVSVGTLPSTVSGEAVVCPSYPQAARPAASAMTAAMTGARRIEGESNRSNVHRTPYEIAPAAATCCGVSFTSSDTATATSNASPAANRGRRVARTTSATIEMANTSAACHEDTSRSTEMCSRLASSRTSAPGPSPTRRVT